MSARLRVPSAVFREKLLPPEGLVAFPGCTCPNPLDPHLSGAGTFLGINAHTTRNDLLRALAAGMVFELRRFLQPLAASGAVDSLVLGGGASKGAHFRKLIAALFYPLPVYQQVEEDLSAARGAVHVFSAKAAHGKTKRLPRPPADRVDAVHRAYERYEAVFERGVRRHARRARIQVLDLL